MALLQFMDFEAKDFTSIYPDINPGIGGVWFVRWDQWEPNQGQYNVNLVRNWLAAEAKNRLQDGSLKPLILFLLVHTAPAGTEAEGKDYTPGWVKAICPSVTIDPDALSTAIKLLELQTPLRGVKAVWRWLMARLRGLRVMAVGKAVMPAYGDARWWQYLFAAARALALETDGQVQIIYEDIGIGCDGEAWPMKAPWNAYVKSSVERMFGLKMIELLDVYRASHTQTKLAIRATPGSGRKTFVTEAIKRGIGYHFCGMQPAAQNAHGWGNEYGTWDGLRDAHAAGLPALAETTFGMGTQEAAYWSILGMLALKVDAMDVHPEWLSKVPAETWTWAIRHVGKGADKAPSAWIVLRDYDSKYKPVEWTGSNGVVSGQSDWPGDFCYYLRRTSSDADAPRYEDVGPADAPESRQCRRVTRATFQVDDHFAAPPYTVSVRWLAEPGNNLSLLDDPIFANPEDGQWKTSAAIINARTFTLTGNAIAVHSVTVKPIAEPEPPEPPEPDVDTKAILAAEAEAREAIESAAETVERASHAVGVASSKITVAAQALQEAVDQQNLAVEALLQTEESLEAAMAQLDTITKEASGAE